MKTKDERVLNPRNKIYREIYYLIIGIVLLSAAFKIGIYGSELKNIVTELVILLVQGVYYSVRMARTGLFSSEVELHDRNSKVPMRKKTLLFGVITGVVMAFFFGMNSAVRYADGPARRFINSV